MSKIWEAFKEVLSEEQLSDEVKKHLLIKLMPYIVEAFNQILIEEEQFSEADKKRLLAKLCVALEPSFIDEQPNHGPSGPCDSPQRLPESCGGGEGGGGK